MSKNHARDWRAVPVWFRRQVQRELWQENHRSAQLLVRWGASRQEWQAPWAILGRWALAVEACDVAQDRAQENGLSEVGATWRAVAWTARADQRRAEAELSASGWGEGLVEVCDLDLPAEALGLDLPDGGGSRD